MTQNPDELAGATPVVPAPYPMPEEPREVFPVRFDKDYMDFRGTPDGDELVPKASSAPVSVETPKSPTGLEDVFEGDLETSVQQPVEKDTKSQPASGS